MISTIVLSLGLFPIFTPIFY